MTTRPKIDVFSVASCIVINPDPAGGPRGSESRKDDSGLAKLKRLKYRFDKEGTAVRSVEAVMLLHAHSHPHVLLIRRTFKPSTQTSVLPTTSSVQPNNVVFRLPGGKVRPSLGESEVECLHRKLARDVFGQRSVKNNAPSANELLLAQEAANSEHNMLTIDMTMLSPGGSSSTLVAGAVGGAIQPSTTLSSTSGLRVGEVLGQWCRPTFDRPVYPYVPAHVSEPKEIKTLYLIHLPPECELTVSHPDDELVGVPLFDLYENSGKYGAVIASIPHLLSRFQINYC